MDDLVQRTLQQIHVYQVAADEAANLHVYEAAGKVKGWRANVTNKAKAVHPFHEWIAKRKALYQPGTDPGPDPPAWTALHDSSKKIQSRDRSHSRRTVCGRDTSRNDQKSEGLLS